MPNILILVTGSVAAIKLPLLIDRLQQLPQQHHEEVVDNINIRVVVTEASLHFFNLEEVQAKLNTSSSSSSSASSSPATHRGDQQSGGASRRRRVGPPGRPSATPVLHIELRNWAHLGLVAPLDANTLGKVAAGQCDNLLTCVLRAWDAAKPLLFAPAMNVHMWEHPLTGRALATLTDLLGYHQMDRSASDWPAATWAWAPWPRWTPLPSRCTGISKLKL
ncbi:hypothetical protein TYRP_022815 [Tyrophagus putrescentiae]|nr:hypothetical protein TYRP_022815 [Tyrophagus putrescentiae]